MLLSKCGAFQTEEASVWRPKFRARTASSVSSAGSRRRFQSARSDIDLRRQAKAKQESLSSTLLNPTSGSFIFQSLERGTGRVRRHMSSRRVASFRPPLSSPHGQRYDRVSAASGAPSLSFGMGTSVRDRRSTSRVQAND